LIARDGDIDFGGVAHIGTAERLENKESFVYLVEFGNSIGVSGLFDYLNWVDD